MRQDEDRLAVIAWWVTVAFLVVAIVLVGAWAISEGKTESRSAYERGAYDGAHDLCQEVGGTWRGGHRGWCDMPEQP